jgi:murein L,D-transpeptidase YcbB/YkuD
MSHIIFQPEWGVPESIKLRQILPHMRGGDYGVLARRGMQIKDGERAINPARLNSSKADIRNVPVIQGPGPGNPLGRLKFMFPNHHDVYMHDTNDKYLFHDSERTFSHGCIRVRDPERFAEVILGEVAGWKPGDVAEQLKNKKSVRVDLPDHLPVHNTYLTTWVNADGSVLQFKDIYAHDKRYSEALAGKSIQLIAARDPALALKKQNEELRKGYAAIMPVRTVAPPPVQFGWFGIPLQPPVKTKGKPQPKKVYSSVPPPQFRYLQP